MLHGTYNWTRATFTKYSTWRQFQGIDPWSKYAIYNCQEIYRTGFVLDKKSKRKCHVLTKENLHETYVLLVGSPQKSLSHLPIQCGISKTVAHMATILSKLKLHKLGIYTIYYFQQGNEIIVLQVISTISSWWLSI